MAIKAVTTPPREGGLRRANLVRVVGKPGTIPLPVFSRIPSATIAGRKASWPMYAGLGGKPPRVTDTGEKIGDHYQEV